MPHVAKVDGPMQGSPAVFCVGAIDLFGAFLKQPIKRSQSSDACRDMQSVAAILTCQSRFFAHVLASVGMAGDVFAKSASSTSAGASLAIAWKNLV